MKSSLAVLLMGFISVVGLGQEAKWEAVKLKKSPQNFGSLAECESITVEGTFTDTSRTYQVVDEKVNFVKITDGKNTGWVFRASVKCAESIVPVAPPKPSTSPGKTNAVFDPIINTLVFYKDSAVAKIEHNVLDKSSVLSWPDVVTDINGEWLWLGSAWVQRSEVMTLDEALSYYNDAVKKNPESAKAWSRRASCWRQKGEVANCLADYDQAIRLEPTTGYFFSNRGNAKMAIADYEGAIRDYSEAIRLAPEDRAVHIFYFNRGRARVLADDYEGAMEDYDNSLKSDPGSARAHYLRGLLNTRLRNYVAAVIDLSNALQLDPRFAEAYAERGQVRFELGDFAGAIQDYDLAVLLNHSDPEIYGNRGFSKMLLEDIKGAVADYDIALTLNPELQWVYNARGYARVALRDYKSALADFNRSIELSPRETSAYCNKSVILSSCPVETLRDAKEAIKAAESALMLEPTNPEVLHAIASALALNGDFDGAIEWQRKAMMDKDWMEKQTRKDGNLAEAQIAKWKSKEIYLLPE